MAPAADGRDPPAYATDGGTNRIWRSTVEARQSAPRKDWKPLECGSVKAPGDIAVLGDGSLVVVDGGSIVKLEAAGVQDDWDRFDDCLISVGRISKKPVSVNMPLNDLHDAN